MLIRTEEARYDDDALPATEQPPYQYYFSNEHPRKVKCIVSEIFKPRGHET